MSHQPYTQGTGRECGDAAWYKWLAEEGTSHLHHHQHEYGGPGGIHATCPWQLPVGQFEFKEISREEHLQTLSDGTEVSKTATTVVVKEGSEVKKILPTIFLTKLFTNFDLKNLVWIQIESRFS
jgi:hypothetical protein